MKTWIHLMLAACVALSVTACKQEDDAPKQATVKPVMAAPTSDSREAWQAYLQDIVPRHMEGITNQPFVYMLPAESDPDFQGLYDRLLEKAKSDVERTIASGTLLAYGGSSSPKTADMIVAAFKDVKPDTMKGVRVLFIGKAGDNERVKAAVTPSAAEYVFVEAK